MGESRVHEDGVREGKRGLGVESGVKNQALHSSLGLLMALLLMSGTY